METGNYFLLMMLPIHVIYLKHVDKQMSLKLEELCSVSHAAL